MGFKTLTIKEEVYKKLMSKKGEGESFSEFLDKLSDKAKPDLMQFFGAWKNIPQRDIEKARKEFREKSNRDAEERFKKILKMWEK